MSVTKKDIAKALAKVNGINYSQGIDIADKFFDSIKKALSSGDKVSISGFGNFNVNAKTARLGRNPKTGEEFVILARKVVTFKASPKLKEQIDY